MPEVWDVVRVPFPYTDRPVRQHRPALVIAAPASNGRPGLLWVLMITSAANRGWVSDVMISDCVMAGLPVPALVRTAKVATIERRDAQKVGCLHNEDRVKVAAQLRRFLPPSLLQ